MNETTFRNLLQISLSKAGLRLFRNNTGVFFTEQGIPTRSGLCKGSGDLIGWIPAGWIGNDRSIFLSIETKTGTGRVRTEQESWLKAVNDSGGVAIIARPGDDVLKNIRDVLTSK